MAKDPSQQSQWAFDTSLWASDKSQWASDTSQWASDKSQWASNKSQWALPRWLAYLESLDPGRIELGLDRIQRVFNELGPSIRSEIVVVGGTNGKGSTVAVLQALLLSQGSTVGSYVSPHLQTFNERICFQSVPVDDEALVQAFQSVEGGRGDTPLTYFEFTTLAAIQLLAQKDPDYLIFEVGLGGRLDAVNILDADISIVTGVALDHTDWLGKDLEGIGFEKAGIYRAGKPAIFASEDCPGSVLEKIEDLKAIPFIFGRQLSVEALAEGFVYRLELGRQSHRIVIPGQNLPASSILAAMTAFALLGFELNSRVAEVISGVTLAGRYQYLVTGQTHCVLDVAHNAQAAAYLAGKLLADDRFHKPAAIVGTMSDKALADIFRSMVAVVGQWFLVQPATSRAATLDQQRRALVDLGVKTSDIHDVGPVSAIGGHLTKIRAAVVFGSFYTVGEFLDILDNRESVGHDPW